MHPERKLSSALLAAMAITMVACSGDDELPVPPPSDTPPTSSRVAQSQKANLRFKRDARLRNDFAEALALEPGDLCQELGAYSCTDVVHRVALGGVQPYDLGIVEPAAITGATTPLVVERIALAACGERVDRDLANPAGAVLFVDLPLDGNGALIDVDAPAVTASLERLYRRGVQRNPTPEEVKQLRDFYRDVAARSSGTAARDWAIASCFVVLTSMESLFY